MMKYRHVERATALAIDDVETLQNIAKRRLIDLKNVAREADSLLVSSVIRNTCIQINQSIDEAIDNARKLLK
jgi:hypothetical protein